MPSKLDVGTLKISFTQKVGEKQCMEKREEKSVREYLFTVIVGLGASVASCIGASHFAASLVTHKTPGPKTEFSLCPLSTALYCMVVIYYTVL